MFSRNLTDLRVVFVLTTLAVVVVLLQVNNLIAVPLLALPLALLLPGYALTAALFPRGDLGVPETLTFSLGLSLALDIVGGLVLSLTPQGLAVFPWMIFLVGVTLGASAIAARRRGHRLELTLSQPRIDLNLRQALLLGLSIVLVVSAMMIVRIQSAQPSTTFTQLWIQPDNALGQNVFNVGIYNSESAKMEYKLEVKIGGDLVYESSPIALAPGETLEKNIVLRTPVDAQVQALLYQVGDPGKIYRQVVWRSGEK